MKATSSLFKEESPVNSILDLAYGFQKSKVLLTACELNLFTVLGDDFKTAKEVAEELSIDPKATERLMNALTTLLLLNKGGGVFSNTESSIKYLVKGKPDYIGDMKHLVNLYDKWETLTESVRLGTAADYLPMNEMDDKWIESFISFTHHKACLWAPEIIDMIKLSKVSKILDLGGGSGAYSMEFIRKKPDLEVVLFDLPDVIPYTKQYLEENGLTDKIKTIAGDYFKDDLGDGYDLVFLSSVLHNYSIWDNIKLARRIYDVTKFKGQIVIHDYILSDDRTKPTFSALYSLDMLVNTQAGDICSGTDVWIALKEAWFQTVKSIKTDFGTVLITANK